MFQRRWAAVLVLVSGAVPLVAAEPSPLPEVLAREVIGPRQALLDVQDYIEPRIPRLLSPRTRAEWEKYARRLRGDILDQVVFRGRAAAWRDARARVDWLETIPGGPGYHIRKLRYEALPGLWIPALLYEPDRLAGKVPVHLAVNGHDRANGKAGRAKQLRCINLAKRGMLVLNTEWLGMGQLATEGFSHYRMNQLDLCGTRGVAPFYLALTRALDVLLALPHADRSRVAVSGLSGGGWQTIFVSALDERVTLANPVAGYSSFRVKVRDHFKDLGDSEQTPCDLATLADYTHLTALRAPRPTLLTFNSKDNCCYQAGYALPPLLEAARPVFKLYGREQALRSHVNDDPGDHNYGRDNREAFYRMVGDFFCPGDKEYSARDIPSVKEVKKNEELTVELPPGNADFNSLARDLARELPRTPSLPGDRDAARKWQHDLRQKLRHVVAASAYAAEASQVGTLEKGGLRVTYWKLRLGGAWTVPVVELVRGRPRATAVLLNDAGRRADPVNAERLLAAGYRVLAVDLFYFGEARVREKDFLFALLLGAVGGRPLGVQASQLAGVARWSAAEYRGPVKVVAVGPRMSVIALVAAGLEEKAISGLELHGALGSLKEVIDKNRSVEQMPELFCFGLLEVADVRQLLALAAPRPVALVKPGERARAELAGLEAWYRTLGRPFDPLRPTGF